MMYSYVMLLDRRAKKRECLRTVAEYKTLKVPRRLKFKALPGTIKAPLLDISIGGCALDSPYLVPPQVMISIRIDPLVFAIGTSEKRKEPLEMTGEVISCINRGSEHFRLGIFFTKIKKKDMDLIRRFMKSKERRKFLRFSFSW